MIPARLRFQESFPVGGRRGGRGTTELQPDQPGIPYRLLIRVLLAAVGALLVLVPVAKALARWLRPRREREPRRLVLATYQVFAGRAADLGMPRGEGETLREYCHRVEAGVRFSDGHLDLLTGITTRAAYSPDPVTGDDARQAALAARTAIRDMRRDTSLVRRLAGVYRPGL